MRPVMQFLFSDPHIPHDPHIRRTEADGGHNNDGDTTKAGWGGVRSCEPFCLPG